MVRDIAFSAGTDGGSVRRKIEEGGYRNQLEDKASEFAALAEEEFVKRGLPGIAQVADVIVVAGNRLAISEVTWAMGARRRQLSVT